MSAVDYLVLFATLLAIAGYGVWHTRGRRNLDAYTKGAGKTPWFIIGLSVMATQASAITFISTPGQGYQSGMGFVQNYFGAPFALIIICVFFLPMFTRMNIYTVYEFLGRRFDYKTRLLGVLLFLLQRGIGAGITIYAPAIVLSTVMGWPLQATIIASGLVVTTYTVTGGTDAVTHTQKYQVAVIFAGMITAFFILLSRLPNNVGIGDALTIAGAFDKLNAVNFSVDPGIRYTFWTGTIGGMFLALSYFGTDQSQVQRYTSGHSLRESRLGLIFNAIFKIPMQFFILLLGALLFVFYQFERPPVFFNQTTWSREAARDTDGQLEALADQFATVHAEKKTDIERWMAARASGDAAAAEQARTAALEAHAASEAIRADTRSALKAVDPNVETNDADYVFITFILGTLPHGVIGLMIAAFFAATMSSKAGELNALGTATTVDLYRPIHGDRGSELHYVRASKLFTALWGLVAIAFALFANLTENLIQAGNIVGSVFYGVPLALVLVAFFIRWIRGSAVFWSAIITQVFILVSYFRLSISYLWYNLIGCVGCILLALVLEAIWRGARASRSAA